MRTFSPARVGRERPRALTTPAVMVPANPRGLPTATTRIAADDAERDGGAVGEGNLTGLRLPHHVGIGQQEPVVGEDDRRTGAGSNAPVTPAPGNLQCSDPGGQLFGYRHDDLGVRVKRGKLGFG